MKCNYCQGENILTLDGYEVCTTCGIVLEQIMYTEYNVEDRTEPIMETKDVFMKNVIKDLDLPETMDEVYTDYVKRENIHVKGCYKRERVISIIYNISIHEYERCIDIYELCKRYDLNIKKLKKYINIHEIGNDSTQYITNGIMNKYKIQWKERKEINRCMKKIKNVMKAPKTKMYCLLFYLSKEGILNLNININEIKNNLSMNKTIILKCTKEIEKVLKEH